MSDKIEEIRARYAGYSLENFGNAHLANEDRGWLLAEVDKLRAEIARMKKLHTPPAGIPWPAREEGKP